MTYDIREAKPADCDAIAALMTELNHEEGNDVLAHADDLARALFGNAREVDVRALVAVGASFPRRRESLATDNADSSLQLAHDPRLRGDDVMGEGSTIIGVVLYYTGYDTLSASYGHHLADIIVTKEHRGRGVGKQLMNALAKETLEAKKEWVSLTALQRNDAAHGFYNALGMTQVDVHFFAAGKQALLKL